MKLSVQSCRGGRVRRCMKVFGVGTMLAMVAWAAGAKSPAAASAAASSSTAQVLVTVEQAAQRFPEEPRLPEDFEVMADLDGDGAMDTVYLSYASWISLMIRDTSIGRTPPVLGCRSIGVAEAAGPQGVHSLYCNESELRWSSGEYVWVDPTVDAGE